MERVFDMLTFFLSIISFLTGLWAISAHWARREFKWDDYKNKDVCAIAHLGNVFSTMLAASHSGLLWIRLDLDTTTLLGTAENYAFFIWHASLSAFFIGFHLSCHKFMNKYIGGRKDENIL